MFECVRCSKYSQNSGRGRGRGRETSEYVNIYTLYGRHERFISSMKYLHFRELMIIYKPKDIYYYYVLLLYEMQQVYSLRITRVCACARVAQYIIFCTILYAQEYARAFVYRYTVKKRDGRKKKE